jgi:hypothetical protein
LPRSLHRASIISLRPIAISNETFAISAEGAWKPEGHHAGLDLFDLLGGVQPGIAGVRAQFPHRTQHNLRGHPGEGHQRHPDLERVLRTAHQN